jgi:two-component system chemotaxis response regulator CheB
MSAASLVSPGLHAVAARIRAMVVDESVMVRHLLRLAFADHPAIEIVAAEASGAAALERMRAAALDVVALDVETPGMSETVRDLRQANPRARIILLAPPTRRGAAAAFEGLALGADDYLVKTPAAPADRTASALRTELTAKISQFFAAPPPHAPGPMPPVTPHTGRFRVLAVAASTGGPCALAGLLAALPARFPLPVMVAQHAPPIFSRVLAERLDAASQLRVAEATDGAEIERGRVLLAPGDFHLRLKRSAGGWAAALDRSALEQARRPAADVLFRSLAEQLGSSVLAVVLSGAGVDGLRGVREIKRAGGCCLAQDRCSSAVWGMPGAVAQAGLADKVLPLSQLAAELVRLAGA